MNSIERSKKIGIGSLQLHGQGFSPVCKLYGLLDDYAVKKLYHIDYIDMDHFSSKTTTIIILLRRPYNIYMAIPQCVNYMVY